MWTSHDCVKHKAPYILHFTTTVQLDLYTACTSIYTLQFDVLMTYRLHEYIHHFDSIAESDTGATGAACTSSQHPSPQQARLGRVFGCDLSYVETVGRQLQDLTIPKYSTCSSVGVAAAYTQVSTSSQVGCWNYKQQAQPLLRFTL
jgi:hypothetical protein